MNKSQNELQLEYEKTPCRNCGQVESEFKIIMYDKSGVLCAECYEKRGK